MKSYLYSVCGLRIHIDSDYPLQDERTLGPFLSSEHNPDVYLKLTPVQKLSHPEGIACSSDPAYPVWRSGDLITRCSWDQTRPYPHFCAHYDLHNPSQISCYVRQECWPWATREMNLWNGLQMNYVLLHHRRLMMNAAYGESNGAGILIFSAPERNLEKLRDIHLVSRGKVCVRLDGVPAVSGVFLGDHAENSQVNALPLKAVVVESQAGSIRQMDSEKALHVISGALCVDRAIAEEWQMAMWLTEALVNIVPVIAAPDLGTLQESQLRAAVPKENTQKDLPESQKTHSLRDHLVSKRCHSVSD